MDYERTIFAEMEMREPTNPKSTGTGLKSYISLEWKPDFL